MAEDSLTLNPTHQRLDYHIYRQRRMGHTGSIDRTARIYSALQCRFWVLSGHGDKPARCPLCATIYPAASLRQTRYNLYMKQF
jgi:hypothetical protein